MLIRTLRLTYFFAILLPALASPVSSSSLFEQADTFFYPIKHNEQIPWGVVTALMQDHEGYIWVGSQKGLLRFDGYRFTHYAPDQNTPGALANSWVESLVEVSPGNIWVGSRKGFSIFDTSTGTFKNYHSIADGEVEISMLHVSDMLPKDKELWVVANKSIVLVNPSTVTAKLIGRPIFQETEINVNSILFRDDRSLWVGTSSGLFVYDMASGEFTKVDKDISSNISSITLDSAGNLWVSTLGHGLRKIANADSLALEDLQSTLIGEGRYSGTVPISDTEIWAMAHSGGIIIYNSQSNEKIKQMLPDPLIEHSLASTDVQAILKDRSGIVWVGQWGGGIRLYNAQNQYVRPLSLRSVGKQQTGFQRVENIKVTKQTGIWLLGGKKAISLDPSQNYKIDNWPTLNEFLKDADDAIIYFSTNRLNPDGSEILYFMAGTSLLFSFHPNTKTIEKLPNSDALDCRDPTGMLFDKLDQLWLSCHSGSKLIRYDIKNHGITFINENQKESIGLINNLQKGPDGNFWISSTNGLYKLIPSNSGKIDLLPIEFFSGHHIISVLFNQDGDIWVDGFSGLFQGKKSNGSWTFTPIAATDKQSSDQQFGNMMFDNKGWIWGDEGALDTGSLSFHPLRKGDGQRLGPNWIGSFGKLDDGTLLFGSDNQLMVIRPEAYTPWDYAAPIVATRVLIDNKPLATVPAVIELDANNESISIDIALLDYSNPEGSTYAYKLEGLNSDWLYTDAENRRINYTNLPAGTYSLKIKGANTSKQWSPLEKEITIIKAASVHETALFRIALAICCLALIWAGYLLKLRHHRARERQLKSLVDERTLELQNSLNDLQATQEKLIDSEKQALLGRLVRGLAHELNTPLSVSKMAESVLGEKITEAARFIADHSESAGHRFYQSTNKTLSLLRDNLEKSVNLVRHFKSVDIEEDQDTQQWVSIKAHIEMLMETSELPCNIDGPDVELYYQKNLLGQVIKELLKNASSHGGDDISIHYQIKGKPEEPLLEVSVHDHLCGIKPEIMEKMFQPFYSSKSGGGSPGLGLYMVENIVRFRLHGSIDTKSELGGRTEFTICLPVQIRGASEK